MFNGDVEKNKIRTNMTKKTYEVWHARMWVYLFVLQMFTAKNAKVHQEHHEELLKGDLRATEWCELTAQHRVDDEINKFGTEYNLLANNMLSCPFVLFVSSNCFLQCVWICYLWSEHFHCIAFHFISFHFMCEHKMRMRLIKSSYISLVCMYLRHWNQS